MAKVMVSEAEYAALKKAASAASNCASSPPPTGKDKSSSSPAAKLDHINQHLIAQDNAKRRDIVQAGESSSSSEDDNDAEHIAERKRSKNSEHLLQDGVEDEGGGGDDPVEHPGARGEDAGVEFSFLPMGRRRAAKKFLHRLLSHPSVDVECGQVYVRGRKIGHIVFVLHHLFGARQAGLGNQTLLSSFLRQSDLSSLLPAASVARKTVPKQREKRNKDEKSAPQKSFANNRGREKSSNKNNAKKYPRKSSATSSPQLNLDTVALLQK